MVPVIGDSRQAGVSGAAGRPDDIRARYPDLPPGLPLLSFKDVEPIEQIFFDWEDGGSAHPIREAFKVYERLGALLRAKGLETRQGY